MMKRMSLVLLVTLLFLVSCSQEDLPPEPSAPGTVTGALAGQAVAYADYSVSTNFEIFPTTFSFSTRAQNELLDAELENEDYVYRFGYMTDREGDWERFEYEGNLVPNSNWLRGSGGKVLPISLASHADGENYILAYGCTRQGLSWDCHDDKWIIEEFNVTFSSIAIECATDSDCNAGYACESEVCVELPESPTTPSTESVQLLCGRVVDEDDKFLLGTTEFEYKGADKLTDPTPKVKFKDMASSLATEYDSEVKAVFILKDQGQTYGFVSASDYNQDDYDIQLRYPCDLETPCTQVIREDDTFTLNGVEWQYKGSDKLTDDDPKVKIKNISTGTVQERSSYVAAAFRVPVAGTKYYFESVSDYNQDDYGIMLVYPCGTAAPETRVSGRRGTLNEGESMTNTVEGVQHEVTLASVNANEAAFFVASQRTPSLAVGERHIYPDGLILTLTDIFYQGYAGGVQRASYRLEKSLVGGLNENESNTIVVDGVEYELRLTAVTANDVEFTVNGLSTGRIGEDGEYRIDSNLILTVTEILYQGYAGGVQRASYRMEHITGGTLQEGESERVDAIGPIIGVELTNVSSDEAIFTVDGQASTPMADGESFTYSNDHILTVDEVLYQDYAGGVHSATYHIENAEGGYLNSGESKTHNFDGGRFTLNLVAVSSNSVSFELNADSTGSLEDGERFVTDDHFVLTVEDILYQNYAGGLQRTKYKIE